MPIEAGQELSHYRLIEKIGEGGMGVVWRAYDTTLERDVAIKVLPDGLANDARSLGRFEREAKLLASLSHPNIAAIYGIEASDGVQFLVLELVPGLTLAEMLRSGPLPLEEALDTGRQIAEGFEAAHATGVIHRDLKPSNVKVTPDGIVKVLDFGLAKALDPETQVGTPSDLSLSPTVTAGTRTGVVLGTAPYMSPEQARGRPLDKRTDIWSFGCLLYESLTGRMAFRGESVPDILSAVLRNDPDSSAFPARTPSRIRDLVERCLEKNPRNRLHDIGDARLEIERSIAAREWTTSGIRLAGPGPAIRRRGWAAAGLVLAGMIAGAALAVGMRSVLPPILGGNATAPRAATTRSSIDLPPNLDLGKWLLSPDGTAIVLQASDKTEEGAEQVPRLYTRFLDRYELTPVQGSEGVYAWAISPDSRWLAFVAPVTLQSSRRHLYKVPLDGSAPCQRIADFPENMLAEVLEWLPDGDILGVTQPPQSMLRFPSGGSVSPAPVELTGEVGPGIASQSVLSVLPGGRHVLAVRWMAEQGSGQLNAVLLDAETGAVRFLTDRGGPAQWSPTGHLLFSRREVLFAAPFDLDRLELSGAPIPLTNDLRVQTWDDGRFHLSANGTLVYRPGGRTGADRHLVFVDREGRILGDWSPEARAFEWISVSPDGSRLATVITSPETNLYEIWVSDMNRPFFRPLLVGPGMDCFIQAWTPDSDRIIYWCDDTVGGGGLFIRSVDRTGDAELLLARVGPEVSLFANDVSPDGSTVLVTRFSAGEPELLALPLEPDRNGNRQAVPLITDQSRPAWGFFSPDGRWLIYNSDETGRSEMYVRELREDRTVGPATLITGDGGVVQCAPRLVDSSGYDIDYWVGAKLMALHVTATPHLEFSEPRLLFDHVELRMRGLNALPDGRFLVVQGSKEEFAAPELHVVLNFDEEIRRRFSELR